MRARTFLALFMLVLINTAFAVLNIESNRDDSITLTFKTGEYTISENEQFSTIQDDQLFRTDTVGLPDIPYYEFKVAVPQNGNIVVNYSIKGRQTNNLRLPLQPVPSIKRGKETDEYVYIISPEYKHSESSILVKKGEYTEFRHSAFIPVRVYPFAYNPTKRELVNADEIAITISIQGNTKTISKLSSKDASIISNLVINPDSAINWKTQDVRTTVNYAEFSQSDKWYRFSVSNQGIAVITYSDLDPVLIQDFDPRSFRIMTTGGKLLMNNSEEQGSEFVEVPIIVEGEDDGVFDPEDRIILYVEGRDLRRKNTAISQSLYRNPYSNETVYWLTAGNGFPESPLRIATLDPYYPEDAVRTITQYPFTYRMESERYRRSQWGFEWYDFLMAGSSTQTYGFTIPVSDIATEQGRYTRFELSVIDSNSDDYGQAHNMKVYLNSDHLTSASWTGPSAKFVSISDYSPVNGNNQVDLKVERTGSDDILLDYIQLTYDRILAKRNSKQYKISIRDLDEDIITQFDFTKESTSPMHIFQVDDFNRVWMINPSVDGNDFYFIADCKKIGEEYSQPTEYFIAQDSDLIDIRNIEEYYPTDLTVDETIDYFIVTPQEFITQANRLAYIYKTRRNLSCKVVTLTQIFDQFNGGMPDPGALKLYFEYLYEENPAADSMAVVLLGSGTFDWRNNSGQAASKNKMIIYQDNSGVTSEDYFAMFRQDSRPEIPIGRIPAKNENDLKLVIDRIEEWNTKINPGWWRNTVLIIADDAINGSASGEYYHSEQAEASSGVIDRGIITEKIFAYDYELDEYQNKPETSKDIIEKINEGTLIWYYIGHGSYDKLGTEDYFNAVTDIAKLTNKERLNLFIAASCDVGEFDSYNFDSLGEQLLFEDNGGSIATISATRECYGTMNTELLKYFLRYNCNERLTVGEALMLAKDDSPYPSNDKKYVLLGDPMLYITPPPRDDKIIVINPTEKESDVYNARETLQVSGKFLSNTSDGIAEFRAYDSDKILTLPNLNDYSYNGNAYYNGKISVNSGDYEASFIIPDDIRNGDLGRTLAYYYDASSGNDYVSSYTPITYNRQPLQVFDETPPEVSIWLDTEMFQNGGSVSSTPVFHADFSDESGINTLGAPGHKILLSIDNNSIMLDLSSYFIYDEDSFTSGSVELELTDLEKGKHVATLVVFDNFNNPRVESVEFKNTSSEFLVVDLLPYPNPMPKKGGWITFNVTDDSECTIKIYTITGRKIRTLKTSGKDYVQLAWDGRDDRGNKLANGTYFVKVTAKSLVSGKKTEKTEKLVIFEK
jgi:hypothetical protein